MLTLRKYPNRKIYNPEIHKNINLSDVLRLADEGREFRVVCHRTKVDVTGMVMARIAADEILAEAYGKPVCKKETA